MEQQRINTAELTEAELKELLPAKINEMEQQMLKLDTQIKNLDGMVLAYRTILGEIEQREAARPAVEADVEEAAAEAVPA